ncbi:MAG TPA: hypothetical protein VIQ31_19870 [Phormidium sp.]
MNTNLYLLLENLLFLVITTTFLGIVGWAWRYCKPYTLPQPLPGWFKIWFGTVQIVGVLFPLPVIVLWGLWKGYSDVLTIFAWYYLILGLQILAEILTLRKFQSVVWVMVPYLYLPYRIWQLYEGFKILSPDSQLIWVKYLLIVEIILWTVNYALDLAQLPRLFRWEIQENSNIS